MSLRDIALILAIVASCSSIVGSMFCVMKLYFDHEVRLKLVEASSTQHSTFFDEIKGKLESIMQFMHKLEINQVKGSVRHKNEDKS